MTIMEHVNGKGQQGRFAPPLPEHTFQDSGITIRIRKVGPMTQQRMAQAIQKEIPEPDVPIAQTELGPEPNPADPTYIKAYDAWDRKTTALLSERMMRYAALEAEVTIDDAARAAISRAKRNLALSGAAWESIDGLTEDENDRVFYILHVACATQDDLREFSAAVRTRSVPTEEAVQRHIATFPGDVSEQADI